MQIEIHLVPLDNLPLNFDYLYGLSSALYHTLSAKFPDRGGSLHDGANQNRLKLFTFSPLSSNPRPEIVTGANGKSAILFGKHIWFRFATILPEIHYGICEALLSCRILNVQGKRFSVESVEFVKPPEFMPEMTWRPFGQKGMFLLRYEKEKKLHFQFPDNSEPGIPDCETLAADNLRHKLKRLRDLRPDVLENLLSIAGLNEINLDAIPIKIKFLPLKPEQCFKVSNCTIKGVPVRAFRCPVVIRAPEAVHRLVWSCGFGSQNSQGFGLVQPGRQEGGALC